jgi:hypothetical protein
MRTPTHEEAMTRMRLQLHEKRVDNAVQMLGAACFANHSLNKRVQDSYIVTHMKALEKQVLATCELGAIAI